MKRGVILAVVFSLLLVGCTNEEAKKDEEVASLVSQAEAHYKAVDLLSAKEVYEKALAVREDPDVRAKYRSVADEIEKTREVTGYIDVLRNAQKGVNASLSIAELKREAEAIDEVVSAFEKFEYVGKYHVNKHVSAGRSSITFITLSMRTMACKVPEIIRGFDIVKEKEALEEALKMFLAEVDYPDSLKSIK